MERFTNIRYEVTGRVGHLVLSRPDIRNALGTGDGGSKDQIAQALRAADTDPNVVAILISADGDTFCAGGDLKSMPPPGPELPQRIIGYGDRFHASVRNTSKPVIAAVQGPCLGAGLGLIAQCDFVLAADDAVFGLPEGRFGHPGGSELVHAIGQAWAKFLIFSGEPIDAKLAVRIGLALFEVPRAALAEAAMDLAQRIARMPEEGLRNNKAAIDRAAEAGGRSAGRLAGRMGDLFTAATSHHAKAPDGRLFSDILREGGVKALKQAQRQQYEDSWVRRYVRSD